MSIEIKTYTTPSKSRSGNGGSSSVQGSSTIINGGSSVDIVKELDTTTLADSNVLSSKRVIKEITDRGHTHANKAVLDNLTQAVIDNSHTHANKELLDKIDQDLSKSADVIHNSFKTKDFVAGEGGKGAYCDNDGNAELQSIIVHKFAEFAELRWNKTSIYLGTEIRSYGGGIIESVTPDKDSNGNELPTGTIKLHLNAGEIGKIAVDDICWGVFHDGMDEVNDSADYDDLKGVIKYAGYFTTFFRITSITETTYNSTFTYALRQVSDSWTKSLHPRAMMHFAQRGNFTNTSRQDFKISTLKYEKIYEKVATWELSDDNVTYFNGYKEYFSKSGITLGNGRTMYISNVVIDGRIKQFENIHDWMDVEQSRNGHMDVGQSEVVTIVIRDGYNRDVTSLYPNISLTRESGDEASDTSWNASHSGVGNPFTISFSDLAFTEERLSTLFNVKARKQDGIETNGAFNYSN